MESVGYCVRVQALEGYGDKIAGMILVSDYTAVLATRHHGSTKENPHYHIVIRTDVKPQAFRVRMKTQFPDGKGNQHMSIKPWDGDNRALSYLFHELEPDEVATLVARKGLTDSQLEELRNQNDLVRVEVNKAKSRASHTLEEDAYHFCTKNGLRNPSDVELAQQIILLALRQNKYMPQPWLLRSLVIKVKFRLLDGSVDDEQAFAFRLAANIFS